MQAAFCLYSSPSISIDDIGLPHINVSPCMFLLGSLGNKTVFDLIYAVSI